MRGVPVADIRRRLLIGAVLLEVGAQLSSSKPSGSRCLTTRHRWQTRHKAFDRLLPSSPLSAKQCKPLCSSNMWVAAVTLLHSWALLTGLLLQAQWQEAQERTQRRIDELESARREAKLVSLLPPWLVAMIKPWLSFPKAAAPIGACRSWLRCAVRTISPACASWVPVAVHASQVSCFCCFSWRGGGSWVVCEHKMRCLAFARHRYRLWGPPPHTCSLLCTSQSCCVCATPHCNTHTACTTAEAPPKEG